VAFCIKHHIVWLDISVANFLLMQIAENNKYFGSVESNPLLSTSGFKMQIMFILQNPKQIVPGQVLENHTYMSIICECVIELNDKVCFGMLLC